MSEVLGLDGKPVNPETPDYNTEVTSLIETALADAKKYKAEGVSICMVMPNKEGGFDIDIYWHGQRLKLLAGAARLAHRLNEKCDEAMEVIS